MIKVSQEINAPPKEIFLLSQDYSRRLEWDSFLREARILGSQTKAGVGVRTFCRAWNGIGIETEYVTFKPPHVVAVKMIKGPWLFQEFAATWRFDTSGNRTLVTFIYHYKVRPRFISPLLRLLFKIEMSRRLRDLKIFVERGR